MKILHTLQWKTFAGTEKVCTDLCNEMSKNHEIYLLASEKGIQNYISNNVHLINWDFNYNRYNPFFLYKTAKILKSISPDIIHCHNTKEIEIMKYCQFFLDKKIPIVATRHNPIIKKKFSLADLGVAVSSETLKFTNAKKNILILNGIRYNKPKNINFKDKFNIIAVGRLEKVKGFDLLIRSFQYISFDAKLRILGTGDERENLSNLIKELNLEEKVELVGFVKNVNDYLYGSQLQVISSYEEGLSIALLEGIFYSNIIIASDIANHKEILGSNLIFDNSNEDGAINLANKINEIYINYDKFIQIFAKIKENKDDFSIEKMTKNYIQAYQNLIKTV